MNETKIFFKTEQFYTELLSNIETANKSIDFMYLAYINGEWTNKINKILVSKVKNGCTVRLLIDPLGTFFEDINKYAVTVEMLDYLKSNGVHIMKFHPKIPLLNHMHTKMCWIDSQVLLFGSSNIVDHCVMWEETNFLIRSDSCKHLDNAIDYFSNPKLNLSKIKETESDGYVFHPSIPGTKFQVKDCIIKLIRDSEKYLRIDTWYFLPNKEIAEELIIAAERGVKVQIIISQKNRFPAINLLNIWVKSLLRNHGVEIFEWKSNYRHHKLYWNDKDRILCGSANLDLVSLYLNNEVLIETTNKTWTHGLNNMFEKSIK